MAGYQFGHLDRRKKILDEEMEEDRKCTYRPCMAAGQVGCIVSPLWV